MAAVVTLRLGDLVDETISNMIRLAERPWQTAVGSSSLDTTSTTTLTLADPTGVGVSTVLEIGTELLLVTGKSADADPVFTVARGYADTTAAVHDTGDVVLRDPQFPRHEVARWVRRSFHSLEAHLPTVTSAELLRETGLQYVKMPADTVAVYSVRHLSAVSGRIVDIGGWQFEEDLPTTLVSTGKALRLPQGISDEDELIVVYQTPYEWDGTGDEDDEIDVPFIAADLPVLFASAYGVMRREVSRSELDRIEEWNQEQAIRAGVNLRMVRDLWGEYYRRLDEAMRVHRLPRHRPYRKKARIW